MHRRGWVGMAFVTALAVAPASRGSDFGYQVTVGAAESDNIYLLPSAHKSDTILNQGVDLTWHEQQSRLTADVDGDLSYLEYLNHTFSNEFIGNFLGNARLTVVPDLLFWDLADNFGQGRTNPIAQITPANRENINYATTGPDLVVPLGGENSVDVNAKYAKVTYQVSPLDSDRISGGVGLIHRLSVASSISLNVNDAHTIYSNDIVNEDYTRQDAFVRYDVKGLRTTIGIDLGYSKLRDNLAPDSGVLARFEATRKLSSSMSLSLILSHQFSDAADTFRLGQALGGANLNTQTGIQSGAPFTSDMADVTWAFQKQRTGFGIEATYFKDTYQQPSTNDDKRTQLNGHVTRQLTPRLSVSLIEQYLREDFTSMIGSFSETSSDAQLKWLPGRHLAVTLDYSHNTRHSDLGGTDFTENRIWLTLGWGRPAQIPPGPQMRALPSATLY
jgi:Putative beta-barrel porin 2